MDSGKLTLYNHITQRFEFKVIKVFIIKIERNKKRDQGIKCLKTLTNHVPHKAKTWVQLITSLTYVGKQLYAKNKSFNFLLELEYAKE